MTTSDPMTAEKCEPPPELRGVDGWHWVQWPSGREVPQFWGGSDDEGCQWHAGTPTLSMRYLSPVLTPAEVEALRQKYQDDMHAAIVEVGRWSQRSGQLEGERDAVAIAFRKLGAVLRVNMLRWAGDTSHGEIDDAIDACLGPVSRRVMNDDHIPDTGKMVALPVVKDCLTTQAAYRAGAEAMREAAAEQVDCGCSWRADALAATNKGERFVACGNDPCGAIEARAIRALPLPAAPEEGG